MSANLDVEKAVFEQGASMLVAVDEVGRGALAGPVSVGAVLIGIDSPEAPVGVADSKKLTAKQRRTLVPSLQAWADGFAVAHVPASRIDEVGIMTALGEGASAAIDGLTIDDLAIDGVVVLLDGTFDFLTPVRPGFVVRTVVGGDAQCASIAAASILAKEERDALMRELHGQFPHYRWDSNVGYGTAAHRRAIIEGGPSCHHRRSWNLTGSR